MCFFAERPGSSNVCLLLFLGGGNYLRTLSPVVLWDHQDKPPPATRARQALRFAAAIETAVPEEGEGSLGGSVVKKSDCTARDPGSIPRLGRSPREGNGNPLQYSFLENPRDRGAWWITVHGVTKSWT